MKISVAQKDTPTPSLKANQTTGKFGNTDMHFVHSTDQEFTFRTQR